MSDKWECVEYRGDAFVRDGCFVEKDGHCAIRVSDRSSGNDLANKLNQRDLFERALLRIRDGKDDASALRRIVREALS